MKPFDLQKAKAGALVMTKEGQKVRILTFSAKQENPIVALVEIADGKEVIRSYGIDGKARGFFSCYDKKADSMELMMVEDGDKDYLYGEKRYCATVSVELEIKISNIKGGYANKIEEDLLEFIQYNDDGIYVSRVLRGSGWKTFIKNMAVERVEPMKFGEKTGDEYAPPQIISFSNNLLE